MIFSKLYELNIIEGKDPETAELLVKIYKMAAIPQNKNIRSDDVTLYQYAEKKELFNRLIIMRYLKMAAVDCIPNYSRNVRETDVDFSIECDYGVCKYPCYSGPAPTKDEIDYTTFDILYSDETIEECIQDIVLTLQNQGSITLEKLYQEFSNKYSRQKIIIMAIDRLMTEKRQVPDRFGYGCYINSDGFQVFTQREFPAHGQIEWQDLSFYGKDIIGVSVTSFDQIVEKLQYDEQVGVIDEIASLDDPTQEEDRITFNQLLRSLSLPSKANLLERSLIQFHENKSTTVSNTVLNKFQWYTFSTMEPYEDIETSSDALINQGLLKGKKVGLIFKGAPPPGSIKPNGQPVEEIYLHTLYSTDTSLTSYTMTTKFNKAEGRIRIYKPSEGLGWRDANDYEHPVYNHIIQQKLQKQMEPYEQNEVYGTILSDDTFRIRHKGKINSLIDDGRADRRGRDCKSWGKGDLVDLAVKEGITPPNIANLVIPYTERKDMIEYLIREKHTNNNDLSATPIGTIALLVKWYRSKISREGICQLLQNHFDRTGRLMVTEPQ
jgi:hypothetical protein